MSTGSGPWRSAKPKRSCSLTPKRSRALLSGRRRDHCAKDREAALPLVVRQSVRQSAAETNTPKTLALWGNTSVHPWPTCQRDDGVDQTADEDAHFAQGDAMIDGSTKVQARELLERGVSKTAVATRFGDRSADAVLLDSGGWLDDKVGGTGAGTRSRRLRNSKLEDVRPACSDGSACGPEKGRPAPCTKDASVRSLPSIRHLQKLVQDERRRARVAQRAVAFLHLDAEASAQSVQR